MLLDPEICYRAHRARDARFDGRFFTAVDSTRIYCRPVCTAPLPRRENCRFYPSAAAAEQAGFRPCLRCRPELAPGLASVDASARLARTAASLIDDGALADANLASLAQRVGVTDRHLRRVFEAEFGVTPIAYAQTARLLLAKRLLTDTAMPVTDVALAAGFGSVRRLNALFAQRYRMSPSALRRTRASPPPDHHFFALHTQPPFDFAALLRFHGERAARGVEAADAAAYRRTLALAAGNGRMAAGWIEVRRSDRGAGIAVRIDARLASAMPGVLAACKRAFDLDCRPDEVAAVLGQLAAARPGLRLPGAFDAFELGVRAIIGRQATARAAHTLTDRLVQRFGAPLATPFAELDRLFPDAACLASARPAQIADLGIVAPHARAVVALARAVADSRIQLDAAADVPGTVAALRALPGVDEWTAQYIAMRALHWPDAFAPGDAGVLKAMGCTPAQALARAERWRPWRAYAVIHLWKSLEHPDDDLHAARQPAWQARAHLRRQPPDRCLLPAQ
jgi:AraC family transcriptional regulator of adaptative response / DNA-3-methyladenine glycosylase II